MNQVAARSVIAPLAVIARVSRAAGIELDFLEHSPIDREQITEKRNSHQGPAQSVKNGGKNEALNVASPAIN